MRDDTRKLGPFAYFLSGLSFVPLVGLVFGAVTIAWGSLTARAGGRRLSQLGAVGMSFGITVAAAVYYVTFVQQGDVYDRVRVTLAERHLDALARDIEIFKLNNGRYPRSLDELVDAIPEQSRFRAADPTSLKPIARPKMFYYERVGADHYELRSAGLDGVPYTSDDIVPQVDARSSGLLASPIGAQLGAVRPQP